jgi:gliding motility-associated-like protein
LVHSRVIQGRTPPHGSNRILKILNGILTILALTAGAHAFGSARFIENAGQWDPAVRYVADGNGVRIFILDNSIKYVLYEMPERHDHDHHTSSGRTAGPVPDADPVQMHAVEVFFSASRPQPVIVPAEKQPGRYNYFYGNDPEKWATNLPSYGRLQISGLYRGIDLVLYSEGGHIKYDWLVRKDGRPEAIRLRYEGQKSLELREGQLIVHTPLGEIREGVPLTYQESAAGRVPIDCRYRVENDEVYYELTENTAPGNDVVIDPEVIFSTYSGSVSDNWGFTATFDDAGNLYSGGIVAGPNFPIVNGPFQERWGGFWDVAILKYDSTGSTVHYSTFLGGNSSEVPASLIVNHRNELLVYGTTSSTNFPVTDSAYQRLYAGGTPLDPDPAPNPSTYQLVGGVAYHNGSDMYVARISSDGDSLLSSTLIGGSNNDGLILTRQLLTKNYGDQFRGEIFIDDQDNVYVASTTSSPDFPIVNGFQDTYGGGANDGVVFKFNHDLSALVWSSFIGGAAMDAVYSIRVDGSGNVYAGGGTNSADYPTTPGAIKTQKPDLADIDGVISLIASTGDSLLASSYVGTPAYDQVYMIDLDSSDNVYLLGQTQGQYPVTAGVYVNHNSGQFLHKMGTLLDTTYFSTTVGSGRRTPDIRPTAFLVNECENIFISGWGGELNDPFFGYIGGSTTSMPVTDNAFQKQTDGSDFYLMVLLRDAQQLLYGTYYGEIGSRDHVDGGTSRFDKRGIVYQSVCASCRGLNNFPTTPGVWSSTNNSTNCNNAAFKFDLASLLARFDTDTPEFDQPGIRSGCYPLTIVFLNQSIGGEDFSWTFGEGTETTQPDSITVTYEQPGIYDVTLTATDINTCVRESVARGTITVFEDNFSIMDDDSICFGDHIELYADGAVVYSWEPADDLSNPNIRNPLATPDSTVTYRLSAVDINQCSYEDSVQIVVVPSISPDFSIEKSYDCASSAVFAFLNNTKDADTYLWDFGDGNISAEVDAVHKYSDSDGRDTYTVRLTAQLSGCLEEKETTVQAAAPLIPNFISPNGDEKNERFVVINDEKVWLRVFNRWGDLIFENREYNNDWAGKGLAAGVYFYEITFPDMMTTCKGWVHLMR